jgi:hypothetical protein
MKFNFQSLTVKIAVVVLLVSLISVGLVAFFSGWITTRAYDQLVLDQLQSDFAEVAATHYAQAGSWNGFQQAFAQIQGNGGPPPEQRHRFADRANPNVMFPFTLLDDKGCVVGPANQPYKIGDCSLPAAQVRRGKAVTVNNQQVGTVVRTGTIQVRDPGEEAFLQNIGRGLVLGAVGAGALALLLGIGLARPASRYSFEG